jgi:hypothetical protein
MAQMLSRKKKGKDTSSATSTHPTSTSSVAASSAARSDKRYEMVRDGFSEGFGALKDVSEATEILAPLKATSALMVRALEITKVCQLLPQNLICRQDLFCCRI